MAERQINSDMNMNGNLLLNMVVETVDELEGVERDGRLVFRDGHLWLCTTDGWLQIVDSMILADYELPDSKDAVATYEFTDEMVWTAEKAEAGATAAVQVYDADGDQMYADIVQDDTTVTVTFGAPASGTMVVVTASASDGSAAIHGSSDDAESACVTLPSGSNAVEVENASGVWVITHNLGRVVFVQMYDENGDQMYADVVQDMESRDYVTVTFAEPVTGTIVIL